MLWPPTHSFHGLLEDLMHLSRLPLELRLKHRDVAVLLLLEGHQVRLVAATKTPQKTRNRSNKEVQQRVSKTANTYTKHFKGHKSAYQYSIP